MRRASNKAAGAAAWRVHRVQQLTDDERRGEKCAVVLRGRREAAQQSGQRKEIAPASQVRAQQQRHRPDNQQRHRDVGRAEMGVARVDEHEREKQGGDERRRFVPELAGEPVHHEHRRHAGSRGQRAADEEERLPAHRPARDQVCNAPEGPGGDSPRVIDEIQAGQHPHVQPGIVVEGRPEVAAQEIERDVDDLRLVGTRLCVRQPESETPESDGGRKGENARQ